MIEAHLTKDTVTISYKNKDGALIGVFNLTEEVLMISEHQIMNRIQIDDMFDMLADIEQRLEIKKVEDELKGEEDDKGDNGGNDNDLSDPTDAHANPSED